MRSCEVPGELLSEVLPGCDGFVEQTFVPFHRPFLESSREESAFDGAPDPSVVEERIDVLNMLVRIRHVVVGPKSGQLL